MTFGDAVDARGWAETVGSMDTMQFDGHGPGRPLTAYTDGAAKGNPGPAGWAWWVSDTCWASGGWEKATNNVAELTAVAQLLEALSDRPDVKVTIVTDSTYVRDSFTKWIHGYRRNGWRTSRGTPVANAALIQHIDRLIRARGGVDWRWQRGHAGAHGNTQADARASAAAEAFRRGSVPDGGPGMVT